MPEDKPATHRKNTGRAQSLLLLVVGVGLVLVAIAAFLAIPRAQAELQQVSAAAQPLAVDFPAPEVKLTDLNNKPVALSDFKGQVVLYNAWATWCPPCKEEMPTLNAYYQAHRDEGFVIVAIEDGEPLAEVADFVKSYGLTFPVWPDPKWVATTAFKTEALPTSFVIDRSGQVVLTWTGPINRANLEKYVTPVINQ
ncbi:MAG TPA: TlpA disulfide reductase family protein [Anaerolineales bacterium]|jgi:thiol-disulfide isomerase/thioredoxin